MPGCRQNERHQHRAATRFGVAPQNRVALAAQRAPPRGIADALGLEQPAEDVVLVDERETQRVRQPAPKRRLSTSREARHNDKRLLVQAAMRRVAN